MPAVNVCEAVTGVRWTVTEHVPGPTAVIPAGRTRLTTRVTSPVAPLRSTVAVSIDATAPRASASPSTVTAAGLTVTLADLDAAARARR